MWRRSDQLLFLHVYFNASTNNFTFFCFFFNVRSFRYHVHFSLQAKKFQSLEQLHYSIFIRECYTLLFALLWECLLIIDSDVNYWQTIPHGGRQIVHVTLIKRQTHRRTTGPHLRTWMGGASSIQHHCSRHLWHILGEGPEGLKHQWLLINGNANLE